MPLPSPVVAADALSGLALSHAINSRRSFAGRLLRPTIQSGATESIDTGSKSFR